MHELRLWWDGRCMVARGARGIVDLDDGEGAVAGALPFERGGVPALFEIEELRFDDDPDAPAQSVPAGTGGNGRSDELQVVPRPSRAEYTKLVGDLVAGLRAHRDTGGVLKKVVLARRLDVVREEPFDLDGLTHRLRRDRGVTTFLLRLPDAGMGASPALVGASPELLVEKSGAAVRSSPLAGSAPRGRHEADDEDAARALLRSAKDLEEHRIVVEHVLDVLAPYCSSLDAPKTPTVARTDTMWHLETRIEGELRDPDVSSLELARRLHPTPAVCGTPFEESARLIHELEPFRRGLYAGAFGWNEASGDGRWMVTLRCAEVCGSTAALYAGAGIVADSDPEAECEETSAKFGALLEALDIGEADRPGGTTDA